MLQQPILSLFTRMIPEAFLIIYSICLLTNSKVDMKKILVSGVIGGIGVFIIRLLPIHFGVHTILSIMLYIILAVKINNVDIYKAVATALIAIIIMFIADSIVIAVCINIFKVSSAVLLGETWIALAAGIPSLILFYLIVTLIVKLKKKKAENGQN